jgi:hypothetical protein
MKTNLGDLIDASVAQQTQRASRRKPNSKKAVEARGMAQKWHRIKVLRNFI